MALSHHPVEFSRSSLLNECVFVCICLCVSAEEAGQKPPEEDEQVQDTWATRRAKSCQLLKHLSLSKLLAAHIMCIYLSYLYLFIQTLCDIQVKNWRHESGHFIPWMTEMNLVFLCISCFHTQTTAVLKDNTNVSASLAPNIQIINVGPFLNVRFSV